ncbi:hypothetical protein BHE74_00007449 [Ensete ventricosum]|nr:hypothetical protein GW17_00003277 [Ensete ventricosum]RWW83994.1 hypothetical protein BHE74_00007449 [Ensete ventricosum]RZR85932.1 hypothetical protein BHM03_00013005 [Ensete ventricosum]
MVWTLQAIDNTPPSLLAREVESAQRIRGLLSSSTVRWVEDIFLVKATPCPVEHGSSGDDEASCFCYPSWAHQLVNDFCYRGAHPAGLLSRLSATLRLVLYTLKESGSSW